MHSKLLSRILVFACIIVFGAVAVLGGLTLDYSDSAWRAMIEASAVESLNLTLSDDVYLSVDEYDQVTEDVSLELAGTATSANGSVAVKVYRTDDLGRVMKADEVGEMGAILSEYEAPVDGSGLFATPEMFLRDGENYFAVVATDASELSAVKVVSVVYHMGTVEPIDPEHMDTTEEGVRYQNNIIILSFKPGTAPERSREIIDEIGGTEVGNIAVLRRYQVKVAPGTYQELQALCQQYLETYSELSLAAPELISMFDTTEEQGGPAVPNDPWATDGTHQDWDEQYPSGNNWGLEAIQAQSAWQFTPYFRNFTVGIIDGGFLDGHDDLRLYFGDDRRVIDDHGTHIAGTIGALHDNATGVSGVMNKGRVFAYPLNCIPAEDGNGFFLSDSEMVYSLVSCVINGSSVVNVSLGNINSYAPLASLVSEGALLAESMATLLAEGYDFVVVQSAGNGDENGYAVDAFNNGWYISLNSLLLPEAQDFRQAIEMGYGVRIQDLLDRVIVVANAANISESIGRPAFELANSSNCGDVVDIAAPGTSIYSTVSGGMLSMGTYGWMSGTSMAAPHVTAVAAMAWSTNPEITGADVKQILLENTCYTAASAVDSPMPGYEYDMVNAYLAVQAAIEFERVETFAEITVKDAQTGSVLPGASVVITEGVAEGGPNVGTFTTDAQGIVMIALDSGDYHLTITKDGFISSSGSMTLQPDVTNRSTWALSRELGENEFRIVLTWGSSPNDLDSHLLGYYPGTSDTFRVYYNSKVAGSYANLDVDDTSSYGPETTTISGLPDRPLLYCVHDYSNRSNFNSMALSNSSATVQVMRHTETLATYTVSPNRQSVVWNLFWLMPDGSIVTVDEYTSENLPGSTVFERGVQ